MRAITRMAMRRRIVLPALVLALTAAVGTAQQPLAASPNAACTAASVPVSGETRTRTLYVVAELGFRAPDTTRLYAAYLLEGVVKEFRHPTPMGFTAWGSADLYATNVAVPVIAAEMMVVIKSNGELRSAAFTQSSLVPAMDAAFEAAIRKTVQGDALPPPAVLRIRGDITIFLALTFEPIPDVPPPPKDALPSQTKPLTPPRRAIERSLMRIEVPTARFTEPPRYDEKASKRVLFPRDQLNRGMDGDVSVQFVVGKDGRVTPGTVRLIGATERGFADRILRTLKDSRWIPAEIAGCPVPVLMTQSTAFRIDRW